MIKIKLSIIFFLAFFLSAGAVFCHGVTGVVREGRAVIAEIRYDDGEPFSYSQAKIYSPDNRKVEYQNSRTDASGIVSFIPKRADNGSSPLSDETGHGKELNTGSEADKDQGNNAWAVARRQKMIMSLLLVWAVTATSFYFMVRKKLKKAEEAEG
jgi:hypothetical protein